MIKNSIYSFLLVFLVVACKESKKDVSEVTDDSLVSITRAQFTTMSMEIDTLKKQIFNTIVRANGIIDVPPKNKAKVTSFLGGYIKSTSFLVGDRVRKGTVLVILENPEFITIQQSFLEIAEELKYLKSEFDRQKILYEEKVASEKNYLKAESDYKTALAGYRGLEQKLLLLNINPIKVLQGTITPEIFIDAPISGDIVVMNAIIGMYINPSDVILEIINNEELHVELNVFEKDILKIKEHQDILFKAPEASKDFFKGIVHLVGTSIESNERTIHVHGHVDPMVKQRLLSGMFVEAEIIVASRKAWAIPKEALVKDEDRFFIFVQQSFIDDVYVFKKVPVVIGAEYGDYVEIIPNKIINTQTKILVKGAYDL